jgi:hypothetical protein
VKPNVEKLCGSRVQFSDGTAEEIDLIVYATGYKLSFPFFETDLVCSGTDRPNLFLNVFHRQLHGLFVAGMIQPNSGLWALADYQAQLIVAYLKAQQSNSPKAAWFKSLMNVASSDTQGGIHFVDSPRHVLEVDYFAYRQQLQRLLKGLKA